VPAGQDTASNACECDVYKAATWKASIVLRLVVVPVASFPPTSGQRREPHQCIQHATMRPILHPSNQPGLCAHPYAVTRHQMHCITPLRGVRLCSHM
jgi:hypothetical protein